MAVCHGEFSYKGNAAWSLCLWGLCDITPRHNYFYMTNAVVKGMSVRINSDIHLTLIWITDPQFLHLRLGANDTCGYCEH